MSKTVTIRDTRNQATVQASKQREEVLWANTIDKDDVVVFLGVSKKLGTGREQVQDALAKRLLEAHSEDAKTFMRSYDAMCKAVREAQPNVPFTVPGSNVLGSYRITFQNISKTEDTLVLVNNVS